MSQTTIARTKHARLLGAWRRAFHLTRLALLAPAAVCVLILAAAEAVFQGDTSAAVRTAALIGNTRYCERLAELVMLDNPLAANEALRGAVRSDPRSAAAWISLGLSEERLAEARLKTEERLAEERLNKEERLEGARLNKEGRLTKVRLNKEERLPKRPLRERQRAGDFPRAREAFETAFRVDRQYAAAWALANFCFRRGDQECFWRAASRAAAQAPALTEAFASGSPGSANLTDLHPLLDLAGRMEQSPASVLDLLRLPNDGPWATAFERAYLDDLIGRSRWDDAMTIARRLAAGTWAHGDASDILRFDDFVTRLIAARRASLAVGLWNDYAGYAVLDPAHGLSLTNGDFRRAPRNSGFDWRLGSPAGGLASGSPADGIERLWAPSQLEFRFLGREPEQAPLAEQWLPLEARSYRLRFEYRTLGLPSPTGIHWERASEAASPLDPCATAWCSAQWIFSAARETLVPLRLVYRRQPATARARGSLLLRNVRLEVL